MAMESARKTALESGVLVPHRLGDPRRRERPVRPRHVRPSRTWTKTEKYTLSKGRRQPPSLDEAAAHHRRVT